LGAYPSITTGHKYALQLVATVATLLTSAYGLLSWIEKSFDGVAAAYRAAADSFPTFPVYSQLLLFDSSSDARDPTPFIAVAAYLRVSKVIGLYPWPDSPHWSRSKGTCILTFDLLDGTLKLCLKTEDLYMSVSGKGLGSSVMRLAEGSCGSRSLYEHCTTRKHSTPPSHPGFTSGAIMRWKSFSSHAVALLLCKNL